MLNREDNELLTRIGPGTPMGGMLREYWVPACRSAKLEADGAPARIRLFGENFVAFRATDGRVGFFNEGCPHRCASLALARNEGNGLRCIFHGWKFDVSGKCVETPTEPEDRRGTFAARVPVKHWQVREAGGLVWVYLGKHQENPPRFPDYEFTRLPENQVAPRRGVIHCNWLQGLEALLDSAHVTFLHASGLGSRVGQDFYKQEAAYMLETGAPVFEFIPQPYGFREGALRDQPDGKTYARVREVAFPFASFIPAPPGGYSLVCFSIPIDDEWTAQWYVGFNVHGRSIRGRAPSWARIRATPISSIPTWATSRTCGIRTARRWPTATGPAFSGAATPTRISSSRNRWGRSSTAARNSSARATW